MSLERWWLIARLRLRSLLRPNQVEDELRDEIRFHLDERTRDLQARGMAEDVALNAARRAFGGVDQRTEECRDARRIGMIEDLGKDVRHAFRMMRRSPAVTAVAVLSLALGIGASTAIFTVFDALLLRPLPVDRPDTLRTTETIARIGAGVAKKSFSLPFKFFQALQRDDSVFSEVLAFTISDEPVLSDGTRVLPTTGGGAFVSTNYFSMLKVRPQAGRLFQADDGPESYQVVVLGDRYWRQQFAAIRTSSADRFTSTGRWRPSSASRHRSFLV